MYRARSAALGLLLATLATGCIGRAGAGERGALEVAALSGHVEARAPGGGTRVLGVGDRVIPGTKLTTAEAASVRLVEGAARAVELGPSTDATIRASGHIWVTSGTALARADTGTVALDSEGVSAVAQKGIFRLDRDLAPRIGVYDGAAGVAVDGGSTTVPRLREVSVSAGILPRGTRPLAISAKDAWDRRYLGDALELDRELENLRRGFEAQFGARFTSTRELAPFMPRHNLAFVDAWLPTAGSFDLLTALVVGEASAKATDKALADAFASTMDLFQQGATWGLVTSGRGVDPKQILAAVLEAIRIATGEPQETGGGSSTRTGGGAGSGGGSGSGRGGAGSGGSGGGRPSPSPSPTPSGSPSPPPSPSPSPSPSPAPTPCGILEQLLDPDC